MACPDLRVRRQELLEVFWLWRLWTVGLDDWSFWEGHVRDLDRVSARTVRASWGILQGDTMRRPPGAWQRRRRGVSR